MKWPVIVLAAASLVGALIILARPRATPPAPFAPEAKPPEKSVEAKALPGAVPETPNLVEKVNALLERLHQAAMASDLEAQSQIGDELHAIGFPAVRPIRVDPLGNPAHGDYRFQQAVVRILKGLASPETGLEVLESWIEVDQSKYPMKMPPAVFVLRQYADVVVMRPSPDLAKRVLARYAEAKTREVRLSLIELMGLLVGRFPSLRDDLLRIMLEDADTEVRAGAIAALAAHDPAEALPTILKRLETLLVEASESNKVNATKELWTLVDFLVAALPPDQVLDRLKEMSEKVSGVYSVNHLNTLGFALGGKWGEPGEAGLEILLERAAGEKSRNMQLIYMGALSGAAMKKNPDPRTTDLALNYFDTSKDEWVRSHALSMVTALNRDETTVLSVIDKAIGEGGNVASTGGMQLAFYLYVKNPTSVPALEMIRRHVTTGDVETRLAVLKRLCVSSTPMLASVREIVKTLRESDPDPRIRDRATNVLNWTGGPPPR